MVLKRRDGVRNLEDVPGALAWSNASPERFPASLSTTSAMPVPRAVISSVPSPRVVTPATPRRKPVQRAGLRASNGTGFAFAVIRARASASCAAWPVNPTDLSSSSTMWVSVPPATIPSSFGQLTDFRGPPRLEDFVPYRGQEF